MNLVEVTLKVDKDQLTRGLAEATAEAEAAGKAISDSGNNISNMLKNINPTPIMGLVAAGVALAPVLVTVGTGLAGLGIAALGTGKQFIQTSAAWLKAKADLASFQNSLQPTLFKDFNAGLQLGVHLLHDIQPVAKATGDALANVLGKVDAEFQSGTWQKFFNFMATTASTDVNLLGNMFVALLQDLPPLIMSLQTVATTLLKDTTGLLNFIGAIEKAVAEEQKLNQEVSHSGGVLGFLGHAVRQAFNQLVPGASLTKNLADKLGQLGQNSGTAANGTSKFGSAAAIAAAKVAALAQATQTLLNKVLGLSNNYAAVIGDTATWGDTNKALEQAIDKANGKIGFQTTLQRAAAAQLAASITNTTQLSQAIYTQTGSVSKSIAPLQKEITMLQGLHSNSSLVTGAIRSLQAAIDALQSKTITITTHFMTSGTNPYPGGISGRQESGGIVGAASGMVRSGMTLVGEHGPELVRLPVGSSVNSNPDTQRMFSQAGGSQRIELVIDGSGDLWAFMRKGLRAHIRKNYQGNVQLALGT